MRLLCLGLAIASLGASASAKDATDVVAQIRAVDMAFESRAQDVGAAEAFREFMDETDGLQFGGGPPTRGAEAIYQAMGGPAPAKSRLEWTIVDAWGAASGDLGVTTGTWKVTANGAASPLVTGRYVTVWRKNATGQWKGLIDIGNPDPK
jgi:ketosteroid isomerase-like protein